VRVAQAPGLHEAPHGWIWCRETLDMSGVVTRRPAWLSSPTEVGLPSADPSGGAHASDTSACSGYLARVIQNSFCLR
jgi:hypothetical protein